MSGAGGGIKISVISLGKYNPTHNTYRALGGDKMCGLGVASPVRILERCFPAAHTAVLSLQHR